TRLRALNWLKNEKEATWNDIPISEDKWNKKLAYGQDFGRNEKAFYLPAHERFWGRFYSALGEKGKEKLLNSSHHVLMICGLYGLMTPTEPIQLYNCPIVDGWKVIKLWTTDTKESDVLTRVLLAYIRHHGIMKVLDLTATNIRRRLISWSKLHAELKDNVLHCFGSVSAGDKLLTPFGHLMNEYLLEAPEGELLSITPGQTKKAFNQEIEFQRYRMPSPGKPREIQIEARDLADEVERKRRGVIRFLDRAEASLKDYSDVDYENFGQRINLLQEKGKISRHEAGMMRTITKLRNKVVYDEYPPNERDWKEFHDACEYLSSRAQKNGWEIAELRAS
ncbi:MAG TPA: hypothetical protein VJ044_05020, partial [Candidatus Hodarchaeales archaeon]|nr:hypothetical protein [Candidatus Hodarchaeales archaeon]